jgi:hypothetical protein
MPGRMRVEEPPPVEFHQRVRAVVHLRSASVRRRSRWSARVANIHTSNQLYEELAYEDNKTKDKTKIAADKDLSVWNVHPVDRTKLANTVDRTKLDNTDKPWWYYSIKWEEAVKAQVQIHFKIYKQNRWEDWGCPATITGEESVTNIANTAEKKAKEDGARLYNMELTWLTKEDYLKSMLSTNTGVILIIRAEDLETEGIQESTKHLKEERAAVSELEQRQARVSLGAVQAPSTLPPPPFFNPGPLNAFSNLLNEN